MILESKLIESNFAVFDNLYYNKGCHTANGLTFSGCEHSEETKKQMSLSRTGIKKPKQSIRMKGSKNSNYGKRGKDAPFYKKSHSEKSISKIKEAYKNRHRPTCQYCNKVVDVGNFKRWHGDNCKEKHND